MPRGSQHMYSIDVYGCNYLYICNQIVYMYIFIIIIIIHIVAYKHTHYKLSITAPDFGCLMIPNLKAWKVSWPLVAWKHFPSKRGSLSGGSRAPDLDTCNANQCDNLAVHLMETWFQPLGEMSTAQLLVFNDATKSLLSALRLYTMTRFIPVSFSIDLV